jgi:Ca2+-binding RTX toxin-like protein
VDLGDGDDTSTVSDELDAPVTIAGGPGADALQGAKGADVLDGGPGDDRIDGLDGADVLLGGDGADAVDGSGGADRIDGGAGDDVLRPDGYERAAADVVEGGAGVDRIEAEWSSRFDASKPPVAVTLADGADDGRPGEGDDIRGVERLVLGMHGRFVGSDGPDEVVLRQVGELSELIGLGGDDRLRGGDGPDRLDGGPGADSLDGGFGDDAIVAGPGRDTVSGDLAGGTAGRCGARCPGATTPSTCATARPQRELRGGRRHRAGRRSAQRCPGAAGCGSPWPGRGLRRRFAAGWRCG